MANAPKPPKANATPAAPAPVVQPGEGDNAPAPNQGGEFVPPAPPPAPEAPKPVTVKKGESAFTNLTGGKLNICGVEWAAGETVVFNHAHLENEDLMTRVNHGIKTHILEKA